MQIVIDIDSYVLEHCKRHVREHYANNIEEAIANGTPLTEGHGRLIDADELTEEIKGYISDTSNLHYDVLEEAEAYNSAYYNCLDEIEDVPTIIEADKGE